MADTIMPHTNTIEALTLELDRVNEQKRLYREAIDALLHALAEDAVPAPFDGLIYNAIHLSALAIQKAESR